MGEQWIFLWVMFLAGVVIAGCAIWFFLDNKKHGRPVKIRHYILSAAIALALMFPAGTSLLYHFFRYIV